MQMGEVPCKISADCRTFHSHLWHFHFSLVRPCKTILHKSFRPLMRGGEISGTLIGQALHRLIAMLRTHVMFLSLSWLHCDPVCIVLHYCDFDQNVQKLNEPQQGDWPNQYWKLWCLAVHDITNKLTLSVILHTPWDNCGWLYSIFDPVSPAVFTCAGWQSNTRGASFCK